MNNRQVIYVLILVALLLVNLMIRTRFGKPAKWRTLLKKITSLIMFAILLSVSLVATSPARADVFPSCYIDHVVQMSVTFDIEEQSTDAFVIDDPMQINDMISRLCFAVTYDFEERQAYHWDKHGGYFAALDGTILAQWDRVNQWITPMEFRLRFVAGVDSPEDMSFWTFEHPAEPGKVYLMFLPKWGALNPHPTWNVELEAGYVYDMYNLAHEYAGYN